MGEKKITFLYQLKIISEIIIRMHLKTKCMMPRKAIR